ncbi:peptide methionine sulfoxide reductase-like [Antedon mediterranea]|uniref:peptide methionine sulfoxide reductase-like n=1 Tax=Antedon mediterranea TaxID=105859 RepID=UPI003AF41B8B
MSAIFYHSEKQKELAEKTRDEHQKTLKRKIQTKITPALTFYDAEDYHQKYLLRQKRDLLSSLNLTPKEVITTHVAARLNGYAGGHGSKATFEAEREALGLSEDQVAYVRKLLGYGSMN